MNSKHIYNNNIFKKAVISDNPAIEPDAAIKHRLGYYFNLQHSRHKVHSNSFTGLFSWIFSSQSLVFKSGLAIVMLFFLFLKTPVMDNNSSIINGGNNTTNISVADTNAISIDTCIN
jgi:hypothetical protein